MIIFFGRKHNIRIILSFRNLDDVISDNNKPSDDETEKAEYNSAWEKQNRNDMEMIGLTLSDDHLSQVQKASTALIMWDVIWDISEKHILLNKLADRRRFSTAWRWTVSQFLHSNSATCCNPQIYGSTNWWQRDGHGTTKWTSRSVLWYHIRSGRISQWWPSFHLHVHQKSLRTRRATSMHTSKRCHHQIRKYRCAN